MSKKLMDYDKSAVTNINDFYPSNLKNDFIENLNSTVFNRFLTKRNYTPVIGGIGDEDLSSSIRNVLESSNFAQNNQLQPVLSAKVGSTNIFMTWQDLMRRLADQDVDISNYDTWGSTYQFNWVPPIDLDKFINFRDYYWDTTIAGVTTPDYVTIANKSTNRALRLNQLIKSLSDMLFDGDMATTDITTNTISVAGNIPEKYAVGSVLIIKYIDGTYGLANVASSLFNVITAHTDITIFGTLAGEVSSVVPTRLNVTRDSLDASVIKLSGGDYTNVIAEDFILSVVESTNYQNIIVRVKSSTYDYLTNTTVVMLHETLPLTLSYVDISDGVMLAFYETKYEAGFDAVDGSTMDLLYKILWANKEYRVESSFGSLFVGNNNFVDHTVDFVTSGVRIGDTIEVISSGRTLMTATVTVVATNNLEYTTTDLAYVYTLSNLSYVVYTARTTADYYVQPTSPINGSVWFDITTDELKVYDSGEWLIKYKNVSTLLDVIADNKVVTATNRWTDNNYWAHKTQIKNVSGKIRAQLPIIEFDDRLVLSSMSKVTHDWAYRPSIDVSFAYSAVEPTNAEIHNLEIVDVTDYAFAFTDEHTVIFDPRYGNMTDGFTVGSSIVLNSFAFNNGTYTITGSVYDQLAPSGNKLTRLTVAEPIQALSDKPLGSKITPKYTVNGDLFISPYVNWRYDGVNNIVPSSVTLPKNSISTLVLFNSTTTKGGYDWQSFGFSTGAITNPNLIFNPLLHKLCLYDDYQEGDIRVYINGVRQYGNFIETASYIDDRFVGGIQFIDGSVLDAHDIVLVEVGSYTNIDAGREAVVVNTPSGYELTNLSRYKKIEQVKTEQSQSPEFVVLDSYTLEPYAFSSKIFSYVEDATANLNPYILKKLALKEGTAGNSYLFQQHLKDDDKTLAYQYTTVDGIVPKTVWRLGANNEKYVPEKDIDGNWKIPNNWFYNPHHENRANVSYVELYTHLRSIIQSQTQPGLPLDVIDSYYADMNINYGLGGTIKEHDGNLDILAAMMFNDNVTPEALIDFGKDQYIGALYKIRNLFMDNITELFTVESTTLADFTDDITDAVIDIFEEDSKYDYWFGDSSAFDGVDGVKNWIITLPMIGVIEPVKPYTIIDSTLDLYQLVHHDGHISNVSITPAQREQLFAKILVGQTYTSDTVTNDAQAFPLENDGNPIIVGAFHLRTNSVARTRKLYRFDGTVWAVVGLSELLLNCLLNIETKLYNISMKLFTGVKYDFARISSNVLYDDKMKKQFLSFAAANNIVEPLSNKDRFSSNNPYTWNYFYSTIVNSPTGEAIAPAGDWRQLYINAFGTAYPHVEPWKLQYYISKPVWWDAEYSVDGVYVASMWTNILSGIIPVGHTPPSVAPPTYTYLPVVTIPSTLDGYVYGQLLPPYWNSANNNGNATIRSLFDPNSGDELTKPNLDFTFGHIGDIEYNWKTSVSYNYDRMVAAFKLDPMVFISSTFGYDMYSVDCLQFHVHSRNIQAGNNIVFHGEVLDDARFNSAGLNQWLVNYNRYQDLDSTNSNFYAIFKESEMKLSYLFDSMVVSNTFDIRSTIFDITDKDYGVLIKNTKDYKTLYLDALNLTLISAPSKYIGDMDKGWTTEISTIPVVKRDIKYYGAQNYETMLSGDNLLIGVDKVVSAKYNTERDYIKVTYNNSLRLDTPLGYATASTHTADITINATTFNISTVAESGDTVADLITFLNEQVTGGYFDLELGDILFYATLPSTTLTIADTDLFNVIAGFTAILPQSTLAAQFDNVIGVSGNKTAVYLHLAQFEITNSTNFNGIYTISTSTYDIQRDITFIAVLEDVTLPSGSVLIDGNARLVNAITIPNSWVTGTEVYLNSYDTVSGLSLDRPYYIVRIDSSTIQLANSEQNALRGIVLDLSAILVSGILYVGKLSRTFKSNGGAVTAINWRVHEVDDRQVKWLYDGVSLSGMQNLVDFLIGYGRYNDAAGFGLSNLYKDADTGRSYDWDTFIEKYIDWAFTYRLRRQESKMEYLVEVDAATSSIIFKNTELPNWANGTSVIIMTDDGAILPPELESTDIVNVPYYVVRTQSTNSIKLATSTFDAGRGITINLTDDSVGRIYLQVYEKFENKPSFTFVPFHEYLSIKHDVGITSNIFANGNYIYGLDGVNLDTSQLYINRSDTETNISLLGIVRDYNNINPTPIYIAGMKATIQAFEHILSLNDYTVLGDLVYDKFLGLRTPRFYVEFGRPDVRTLRPSIGGYTIHNNELIQNIESAIDDSRYYYDDIKTLEGKQTTALIRKSLGYDGPKSYMTDIGLSDKSQFIFWKSMIQNKGTNLAIDAFTNQAGLSNAEVDEFWAYKVAEFGGDAQLEYPEMKLLASDAARNELRLEFVPPNNTVLNSTFTPIALTDATRWWNQPDQMESMRPYDTFFFSTTANTVIENVADKVRDIRGNTILVLNDISDAAIITYTVGSDTKFLTEQTDFEFVNSRMIKFTTQDELESYANLTVYPLTYDLASQNPSKIIDRQAGVVVAEVPFWNPALGQYDLNYTAPISNMGDVDIAVYTDSVETAFVKANNTWLSEHEDFIWMDTSRRGYLPYYDKSVMPSIDDRLFNWGKLAEWATVELYQWTASKYTPEMWDELSKQQENNYTIPDSERVSGQTKRVLYKNIGTTVNPTWVIEQDIHIDVIAGLLTEANAPNLYGIISVYVNGRFAYDREITSPESYAYVRSTYTIGTYLHFIRKAHVPTAQELVEGVYKYSTPYAKELRSDPYTGNEEYIYYYWVSNKYNKIKNTQREYTLIGIKNGILNMSSPYMIVQGLRPSGSGFGLVYGNIFDEFGYELPYRYTQLIVKGLEGRVKDDARYNLRFTKDYNLRDNLDRYNLTKKNVHTEWKLFRQNQYNKVDRYLWDRLIESLIGYTMISDVSYNSTLPVPALSRIVYDRIYGTDTRIGFGNGQVFVDADVAKKTITSTLLDSVTDFTTSSGVDAITALDYTTPESIISTFNNLYAVLDAAHVNLIFFNVLYDAMVLKAEHPDIFKTSWVALQISQNVETGNSNLNKLVHHLVAGVGCNIDD